MEYNEIELNNKHYLEIDYPIGRLCWIKFKDNKLCGHVCGYICDNFKEMTFKYCVNVCESIYMVDKVYANESDL